MSSNCAFRPKSMDASMRTRLLKAKTMATYMDQQPTPAAPPAPGKVLDMANRGQSAEIVLLREVGQKINCTLCIT